MPSIGENIQIVSGSIQVKQIRDVLNVVILVLSLKICFLINWKLSVYAFYVYSFCGLKCLNI